jgi:peptide-methionine (S)-S-oxide reductase
MKNSIVSLILLVALNACGQSNPKQHHAKATQNIEGAQTAYFASGCFWCVEAVFESVRGVIEAESGYAGGKEKNPSYELVSSGRSQHAETVKVYYDSTQVSYADLVKVFFGSHDPTTLNRQGPDRGPQYRSMLFYQNEREREIAVNYMDYLVKSGTFSKLTTELIPYTVFYKAEDYHQDYERNHPENSYIQAVSVPRIKAFKQKYPELLK